MGNKNFINGLLVVIVRAALVYPCIPLDSQSPKSWLGDKQCHILSERGYIFHSVGHCSPARGWHIAGAISRSSKFISLLSSQSLQGEREDGETSEFNDHIA